MQVSSILDSERRVGTYSDGITVAISNLVGRGGGVSEDNPGPQLYLAEILSADAHERAHFHETDQFQVFVGGGGMFGKTPIEPVMVQYADAWTPYGPMIGGADGYAFVTVRQQSSAGAMYMPERRSDRRNLHGRQIATPVDQATLATDGTWTPVLGPFDDGVAASGTRLAPGQRTHLAASGVEQFCIVATGTLDLDGRQHPMGSAIRLAAGDAPLSLTAGVDGAILVVVNFAAHYAA